jgi:hypothetical protein
MAIRFHPAPLKEMARLKFRELSPADRETYTDVVDQHALIAYTDYQTWIIEGDMLRIIEVDQEQMLASQQFFALEAWGDAAAAFS